LSMAMNSIRATTAVKRPAGTLAFFRISLMGEGPGRRAPARGCATLARGEGPPRPGGRAGAVYWQGARGARAPPRERGDCPVSAYWPHLTLFALLEITVTVSVIAWVLMTKRDSTAAMAWCLVVILVPLIGAALFWFFGHNRVNRPLRRRR